MKNNPSFNIRFDPWIYVLYADGHYEKIGMDQLFKDADKIKDIVFGSAIDEVSSLVFFITVANMFVKRKSIRDLKKEYKKGSFSFEEYLNLIKTLETEHNVSFDIYDPGRPFMQAANNYNMKLYPASYPSITKSETTSSYLFHKQGPEDITLEPDEVVLTLISKQYLAGQDGRGYKQTPSGFSALRAYIKGNNLFETIVLNIPAETECVNTGELPFWASDKVENDFKRMEKIEKEATEKQELNKNKIKELKKQLKLDKDNEKIAEQIKTLNEKIKEIGEEKNRLLESVKTSSDTSFLFSELFPSRRIRFIPNEDGTSSQCWYGNGESLSKDVFYKSPYTTIVKNKKGEQINLRISSPKDLWLNLDAIVSKNAVKAISPIILRQAKAILDSEDGVEGIRLLLFGACNSNTKLLSANRGEEYIPLRLMSDPEAVNVFTAASDSIRYGEYMFRVAASRVYEVLNRMKITDAKDSSKGQVRSALERALVQYFDKVDSELHNMLMSITENTDLQELEDTWNKTLNRIKAESYNEFIKSVDPRTLKDTLVFETYKRLLFVKKKGSES